MEDDVNWKVEVAEYKRKEKRIATFWNILSYAVPVAGFVWAFYSMTDWHKNELIVKLVCFGLAVLVAGLVKFVKIIFKHFSH